ncbi:MAG TPA: hypothetical protein VH595_18660 [Verrucomicrobiae bacterium]|jgi:hypothetical protein|nr:hypothetical protein [Verrucomicrobiae bacterium]
MRKSPLFSVLLGVVAWLAFCAVSPAQNINSTVAPNINGSDNSVDIQNNSSGDWYFFSSPTPAGAQMSRVSGLSEFVWPSTGNFAPDSSEEVNRIYQGEYLRVYPESLAAGTVITIPFSYTPSGTRYDFLVTVTSGAQVTAINAIDANPTSAATVHWAVSFSSAISGVTAANFAFNNPDSITGLAITSVTANTAQPATNWTVTANTGTGTGILGLNWAGHVSESPSVPNSFVGQYYNFSQYPIISQYPASVGINVNSTATLSVVASLRGGGTPNYQWYSGTSVNPSAAVAISGATSSSYTPPTFTSLGSYQYFVRVYTTVAFYTDSSTAVITVVDPPQIQTKATSTTIASNNTATFSVTATGTSLTYQWYNGASGDTSNPAGGNSATFTSPPLSANSSFWVQVANPGPTVASSGTYTATVITTLQPPQTSYGVAVNSALSSALSVTAKDSAGNLISDLPITFTIGSSGGASGTFAGNVTQSTVDTGSKAGANAPAFTANSVAGVYDVVANYSTLSSDLTVTNYPVINTASATFATGLSNSFTITQTGLTSPVFSPTGKLPTAVTINPQGVLSGTPPLGTGGVYPLGITARTGTLPSVTIDFTLTIVEKSNLVNHPSFETNGLAWALNGGPTIVNNVFQPTDGRAGEDRSVWLEYPLYVGAFKASFIYQDVDQNGADGAAFVLQNSANGTAALGINGGGLGYCGIDTSIGLLMNLYSGALGGASGIMIGTNGVGAYTGAGVASGRSYQSTSPVNLDGGNPILVTLLYSNQILTVTFSDTISGSVYNTQIPVDISAFLGTNAAYVGFTGSEGGVYSSQTISDFSYTPLPTVGATAGANNTVILSWPGSVDGFVLQSNTNLDGTNWVTVPASINQTNNLNQAVLSPSSAPSFYRLTLTP